MSVTMFVFVPMSASETEQERVSASFNTSLIHHLTQQSLLMFMFIFVFSMYSVLATARPELVQPESGGAQAYPTAGAHGLHGGDMHGQILPIYNTGGGGGGHFRSEEHQQLVFSVYALARGVKILALISCFFVMLNFLLSGNPIFFLLFLGPLIGYYGIYMWTLHRPMHMQSMRQLSHLTPLTPPSHPVPVIPRRQVIQGQSDLLLPGVLLF